MANLFSSTSGAAYFDSLVRQTNTKIKTVTSGATGGMRASSLSDTITNPLINSANSNVNQVVQSLTNDLINSFSNDSFKKIGRKLNPVIHNLTGLSSYAGGGNPVSANQQITHLTATRELISGAGTGNDVEVFGLKRVSDILSETFLPMPTEINIQTPIEWSADQLGALGTVIQDYDISGNLLDGASNQYEGIIGKLEETGKKNAIGWLANAVGNEAAGKALHKRLGRIWNPRESLFFDGVKHRNFDMAWNLAPKSKEEVTKIMEFLKLLHFLSLPKTMDDGNYLEYPSLFKVVLKDITSKGQAGIILDRGVCAVTNISCNYTPDGIWASYVNGNPIRIELAVSFMEFELPLKSNVNTTFPNN